MGSGKPRKTSVRITRDPAEIRTEHLPNIKSRALYLGKPILIADSMTRLCVEAVKKENSQNPDNWLTDMSSQFSRQVHSLFAFIADRMLRRDDIFHSLFAAM
jgi:hypothetical protein